MKSRQPKTPIFEDPVTELKRVAGDTGCRQTRRQIRVNVPALLDALERGAS